MSIKRLTTEKQREIIKNSKKYKNKGLSKLTRQDLDNIIIILGKKAGIL